MCEFACQLIGNLVHILTGNGPKWNERGSSSGSSWWKGNGGEQSSDGWRRDNSQIMKNFHEVKDKLEEFQKKADAKKEKETDETQKDRTDKDKTELSAFLGTSSTE